MRKFIDEVSQGRPHHSMIYKEMAELNISSADDVAKIEDTASDMQEGVSAGCKYVISITTGAFTAEASAKKPHTHLIAQLQEVAAIVTL